jgi:quercetin dioxygenase-like cupin family protein
MRYTLHVSSAEEIKLKGRNVYPMVGRNGLKSEKMTFGIARLEPKETMSPHKHASEEEIIYITKGFGKLFIAGGDTEALEPGTAIVAPLNVEHYIQNESQDIMEWCFCFHPPVDIGEKGAVTIPDRDTK